MEKNHRRTAQKKEAGMMGQRQREQVQRGCAVGTVVLLAWLCRVLPLEGMPSGLQEACGILRSLLYLSLFAGWGISLYNRTPLSRPGGSRKPSGAFLLAAQPVPAEKNRAAPHLCGAVLSGCAGASGVSGRVRLSARFSFPPEPPGCFPGSARASARC